MEHKVDFRWDATVDDITNPSPAERGEVRLVLCGRTADDRVLPVDDDSWERGITEEEARWLAAWLPEAHPELPGLGNQAIAKLSAFQGGR